MLELMGYFRWFMHLRLPTSLPPQFVPTVVSESDNDSIDSIDSD